MYYLANQTQNKFGRKVQANDNRAVFMKIFYLFLSNHELCSTFHANLKKKEAQESQILNCLGKQISDSVQTPQNLHFMLILVSPNHSSLLNRYSKRQRYEKLFHMTFFEKYSNTLDTVFSSLCLNAGRVNHFIKLFSLKLFNI